MASFDPQVAAGLVADPHTPAQTLADIAAQHPTLWGAVQQHPNAYSGLIQWIQQAQAAQTAAATEAGAAAITVTPMASNEHLQQSSQLAPDPQQFIQPSYPTQATQSVPAGFAAPQQYVGAPQAFAETQASYAAGQQGFNAAQPGYDASAAPKKKKTALIAGLAIGAVVIAGAAIGIPLLMGGGGHSGVLHDSLKLISDPGEDFTLNVLDIKALEAAVGEPIPTGDSPEDLEDWVALGYDGTTQLIATDVVDAFSQELWSITLQGGGQIEFLDRSSGDSLSAVIGNVSESQLNEAFGPATSGRWMDRYDVTIAQVGGVTYFGWDDSTFPRKPVVEQNSLASNSSIVELSTVLQKTGAYAFAIEKDDYPASNVDYLTGKPLDNLVVYGSAISYRDGTALITTAYTFKDSATAQENLDIMTEAIHASADGLGHSAPLKVHVDGATVVAEFEAGADNNLYSLAFDLRNIYDY